MSVGSALSPFVAVCGFSDGTPAGVALAPLGVLLLRETRKCGSADGQIRGEGSARELDVTGSFGPAGD